MKPTADVPAAWRWYGIKPNKASCAYGPASSEGCGAFDFVNRAGRPGAEGGLMAKDRKRGNREAKKPKANKTPVVAATAALASKGAAAFAPTPKKKN